MPFKYRDVHSDLYRLAEKHDTMQNTAEDWIALRKDSEAFLKKYEKRGEREYTYAQKMLEGLYRALEARFTDE